MRLIPKRLIYPRVLPVKAHRLCLRTLYFCFRDNFTIVELVAMIIFFEMVYQASQIASSHWYGTLRLWLR